MTFGTVQQNFKRKLWSKFEVNMAVKAKVITKEDYTTITGDIYSEYIPESNTLESYKAAKIAESKGLLESFLFNNPILYSDGNYYSVTQEKQLLLTSELLKCQNPDYIPHWNATGSTNVEWDYNDLLNLSIEISCYVTPFVEKQRMYEIEINNCETIEAVQSITISYGE